MPVVSPSYYSGRRKHVATRCGVYTVTGASLSSNEKLATRTKHRIYGIPAGELQSATVGVDFGGFGGNTNQERPTPAIMYRARRITVSSGGGGTGHAVGDVITGGTTSAETAFKVRVVAISGSAITKIAIVDPGVYRAVLADGTAQSASSGSGTGASFDVEWSDGKGFLLREAYEGDFDNPVTAGATAPRQLTRMLDDGTLSADTFVRPGEVALSPPFRTAIRTNGQKIARRAYAVGNGLAYGLITPSDEKYSKGTGAGDITGATSVLGGGGGGYSLPPALILGRPTRPTTAFAIIGTSQEFSQDIDTTGDADGNFGYVCRALGALGYAYTQLAKSGDKLSNVVARPYMRMLLINMGGIDVVYQGNNAVNDLTSGSSVASSLGNEAIIVNQIRAAGARYVIGNYTTPITDSTDGWTTVANQTLKATGGQLALDRNAAFDAGTDGVGYDAMFDNRPNDMDGTPGNYSGKWQCPGGATIVHQDGGGIHRNAAHEVTTATALIAFMRSKSFPVS